jgi:hypothetical protein
MKKDHGMNREMATLIVTWSKVEAWLCYAFGMKNRAERMYGFPARTIKMYSYRWTNGEQYGISLCGRDYGADILEYVQRHNGDIEKHKALGSDNLGIGRRRA